MTDASLKDLLLERARREALDNVKFPSLETVLTSPEYFGLTTASPLQRAICRIIDGSPLGGLANLPEVTKALGCQTSSLPSAPPFEVMLLAGIRTAKSLMAAAAAVRWTQVVKMPVTIGPGEIPRVSIVSTSKENAEVIYNHVIGNVMASKKLQSLVIGAPTADAVMMRHPSGVPIEICVAAGSRAGSTLVARWSCGIIFDEFPRMVGESEGVINWETQRAAVFGRILPGAQLMSIGSPWAPFGPAYNYFIKHHGHPSKAIVFLKAPAWDMNPVYWTKEAIDAMRENNPTAYMTDCCAEFAAPEMSLFSGTEIDKCTRRNPDNTPGPVCVPPEKGLTYRAAMDPATRGNAWTLVIATRKGRKKIVAFVDQKVGSQLEPLSPRQVFEEWAPVFRKYGISTVDTDQYMADALRDIAFEFGIHFHQVSMTEVKKAAVYRDIRAKMSEKELELPPDTYFRSDLQRVKLRPMVSGGHKIILPPTPDGRHCDYAPAFMLAVYPFIEDAVIEDDANEDERQNERARKMKEERFADVRKQNQPWWKRIRK